jgi:hypothetical protein
MYKKINMNKIELINKLIEKSIKKIKLLEELKESLQYEKADYHLVKLRDDSYSLFKISHKDQIINARMNKALFNGNYDEIKSYMKKRKISDEQVFRKTTWEHIISSEK